jgi:hypothetical protein
MSTYQFNFTAKQVVGLEAIERSKPFLPTTYRRTTSTDRNRRGKSISLSIDAILANDEIAAREQEASERREVHLKAFSQMLLSLTETRERRLATVSHAE